MRLHRLLGIIMLLDSRGVMKAGNLAKVLETSERTIYRDIDILCESGIPIMSISGPNGGYSFMDNYKINSNSLGSGDVVNLLLSSMGIISEKNSEMSQQLKNAVIKLENSVSKEYKEEIIKAKEKFFMDSDPWWGRKMENPNVDIIKKSVLNLKKIKIFYKKHKEEATQRIIRPYGVVIKNSEWYMVAFCEVKNQMRIFKCNRIENIEVLEETFSMEEDFNLEEFWENSKQQFTQQAALIKKTNPYLVKMRLSEDNTKILDGFSVYSFKKIQNHWIYDLDMISLQTAFSVIFPISDRVEVLEPIELRNYIVTKTNKIINLYLSK